MTDQTFTPFGKLMKAAMDRRRISQRRLGGMLSDFEAGPILDATSIRMIQRGERRLTHELVGQIIRILATNDDEADRMWHAARLVPEDWSYQAFHAGAEAHRQRRRGDRQFKDQTPGNRLPAARASARGAVAVKRSCAPVLRRAA